MTELLSTVAEPVINKILEDVYEFGKQKYTEVYGVEEEIEKLKSNLSSIAAVMEDAKRYCSKKPDQLIDWLTKLREAALDAEDVLERYATEAALRELHNNNRQSTLLLPTYRSRLNAAAKIKEIVKRMEQICKEKNEFHFNIRDYGGEFTRSHTYKGLRETDWRRTAREVVGREKEKEDIISWLRRKYNGGSQVPVIAIIGMGGLGKTTLAQQVYNDQNVFRKGANTSLFKHAVWVNVSVRFDVHKILQEMAEILTVMTHEKASWSLIEASILNVLDKSPVLVVLDDVWDGERLADWTILSNFLIECPTGSKVLVTTRSSQVADHIGASSIMLGNLPEDDCWELFQKEAFETTSTSDDQFEDKKRFGKEIITKCEFLPLAIKSIGATLRGKPVENWTKILHDGIWKTDTARHQAGGSHVLPALKLSYDHLPSVHKECFAYCSIFPKSHKFDRIELVKLWIAQGYILHPTGADRLEDIGVDCFDELLNRSFFQCLDIGSNERYKMHDLIHDLAISVTNSSQQVTESTQYIKQTCRHVSFLCKDVQKHGAEILRVNKLRTLLLPVSQPRNFGLVLEHMFQSLKYMRVLDLSSSIIIDLPKSIDNLKLLRYLNLSRTEIRVLPSTVCNLLNLQTLKLLECLWFKELPKDLGNLKELRYLELDDMFWYKCSALPPRIGGLTNLHNLHYFHVHFKSGYGIEELKSMNSLEGSLHISKLENSVNARDALLDQKEGIKKLVLEWSKDVTVTRDQTAQEIVLENLKPHNELQELGILGYKGSRFSSWMGGVLQNLRQISLIHCANCKILALGPLPHLQRLKIKGMLELEEWPKSSSYPSLKWLDISNCPKLRSLPSNNFLSLTVMKIKKCHALQAIPVTPLLLFLELFDNESLEDWRENPIVVSIDKSLEGDDDILVIPHSSTSSPDNNIALEEGERAIPLFSETSFFNLIELKLAGCPKFQQLPRGFAPQKLKISSCPLLTSLADLKSWQRFQYLELDTCDGASLVETIQSSSTLDALNISNISNMTSLPKLPHLPMLKSLYIQNCEHLLSLMHEDGFGILQNFKSLKFLSISGCPNLVRFANQGLPTSLECLVIKNCSKLQSFHGESRNYLTRLTSLHNLYLEDCPKLESMPEDGLPSSIKHVCIQGCPLLDARGTYWQMFSHVTDLELDSVQGPETQLSPSPPIKSFLGCFTSRKTKP